MYLDRPSPDHLLQRRDRRDDDLILLTKSQKAAPRWPSSQGYLAAVTPLRDVLGLGSNLPLLCIAARRSRPVPVLRPIAGARGIPHARITGTRRGNRLGWANPTFGARSARGHLCTRLPASCTGRSDWSADGSNFAKLPLAADAYGSSRSPA